jgi:hypothetical protein
MICMLALLPGLFWTGGVDTAGAMRHAGIEHFCSAPALAAAWKEAGFTVEPLITEQLHRRIKLTVPGIDRKVTVASATTAPWVDANGWRFRRDPAGEFYSELTAGTGPLAVAEAFTYGANVVLQIDPADLEEVGKMYRFLRSLPEKKLPEIADFGFIDDGSSDAAEILNLLTRRNLLYKIVKTPDPHLRLNVSSNDENPQLFAAKVREKIKDDQRSLRVYGTEVVLCRLLGDSSQARIHLLNYSRRATEGVRLRVRGSYAHAKFYAPGSTGQVTDFAVADGFTEFSLPEIGTYAVVDLGK